MKRKVKSFLKFGDTNYNDNKKEEFVNSLIGIINQLQSKLFTKKISENVFKIHKYILDAEKNTITFPNGDSLDLEKADTQAIIKQVNNYAILEEDGGGGGAPSGDGGGGTNAGGGDTAAPVSNSGVAYFNQGNVDGMGPVKNATVSEVPGNPNFSEPGSGDVSLPAFTYTKNSGITGNKYAKMGRMKIDKKFMANVNKVKDRLGIGKVSSFKDFLNK